MRACSTATRCVRPARTCACPRTVLVAAPRLLAARSAASSAAAAQDQQQPVVQRVVRVPDDDTGGWLEAPVPTTPGHRVFAVSLKKPLGVVLAEKGGRIVVESVTANGHAAVAGVAVGDVLLATGARAQAESGGGGAKPVLFSTAGQRFATVAAAIRSNTCAQCAVHLVFETAQGQ